MDVKNARMIYRNNPAQAIVLDKLITASDERINAALDNAPPGMVIYNAGMNLVKQKRLDGSWATVFRGFIANNPSSGEEANSNIASDEEVREMLGEVF